jgi:hypothetical protein
MTRIKIGNHTESTGLIPSVGWALFLYEEYVTHPDVEASFRQSEWAALYLSPVATQIALEHSWFGGDF